MASIRTLLGRALPILRSTVVTLLLLGGVATLAVVGHKHYPIQKWLFWRYAGYWLGISVLAAGWLGLGHLALRYAFRVRMPLHAHLATSLALGVFGYQLVMFGLGAAQLYHPATFFAAPLVVLAAVAVPTYRHAKRYWARIRATPTRPWGAAGLALAFGLVGLGMIYFSILTPDNIQFDSRWKHMALAEDFVVHGGIRKFPEGWVFSARPHSSSFLYAWAFLLPGGRLFDHMVLAAHVEFIIFALSTWFGIPALVRRLVPGADHRWVWAARFLFPGVFLYDSSLSGGADHIGAAFAIPIALATFRVLREASLRHVLLLCTLFAATLQVKETIAVMLVPFPAMLLGGKLVAELVQRLRGKSQRPWGELLGLPIYGALAGAVLSAPLWGTNFVLYGDPFYPLLGKYLKPDPWSEAAAYRLAYGYLEGKMWAPTRDLEGLKKTLGTLFTWSFVPNDWAKFHGKMPVIGSLFTLSLAPLLFLRRTRAIWLVVAWTTVALFTWYSIHHQDRYLQGLMPLFASVTIAAGILVWRQHGVVVRGALSLLVGLQIVWGGDVYFIPTHVHAKSVVKNVAELLGSGYEKKYEERFDVQGTWQQIGRAVPKGGRVLLHLYHEHHAHLGMRREAVLDNYLWQFGVEYDRADGPEGLRAMLAGMGVTHVYAAPERKPDGVWSLAADILFWELADKHLVDKKRFGNGSLAALPTEPLPALPTDKVAVLTCKPLPPRGQFRLQDLRALPYGPSIDFPEPVVPGDAEPAKLLDGAGWAIVDDTCAGAKPAKGKRAPSTPPELNASFQSWLNRKRYGKFPALQIWRRKDLDAQAAAPPPPPSDAKEDEPGAPTLDDEADAPDAP